MGCQLLITYSGKLTNNISMNDLNSLKNFRSRLKLIIIRLVKNDVIRNIFVILFVRLLYFY